jgi:hypothetical protein
VLDIRHIQHGGADVMPLGTALRTWAGLATGLPASGLWGTLAGTVCLGIILAQLGRLTRARDDRAVFFAVVLLAAPLAFVLSTGAGFPYWQPRHFLVCLPFFLMLTAEGLADMANRNRAGDALAATLVMGYLIAQSIAIADFAQYGRGRYLSAMQEMTRATAGDRVTIASDHDFRNAVLLDFYSSYLPQKSFLYLHGTLPSNGPDWYITHDFTQGRQAPNALYLSNRREFRLHGIYPSTPLSGWTWCLYRHTEP